MKYFLVLLGWCLPLMLRAAQPLEPLQIAEHFVAKTGWDEMKSYLSGEAAGQARRQSLGQQIPATLERHCQLLQQGRATAVVTVELRDSVSRNDIYLHFRRDSTAATAPWKLTAVRSLAMTQLGPPMLKLLSEMPSAEVAQYNQKHPSADHAFMLGNIQLWIGSDANISQHFTRNQAAFQRAVQFIQAHRYFTAAPDSANIEEQAINEDKELQAILRPLYITRISQEYLDCGSCLQFIIGGVTDNTVGLLYQPNAQQVPPMSPDRVIVIKPLGNGWYLFKTT
ncbi:hypothetical protein HMJ29_05450 [Hymenobacter taeanensis]|uniref:Uncharacterized protein n=1 Tax=Hymenobacter taeanensis TaxID=2735321 RepID=A0A6M6BEL1_9BACT|nr:MULTISPECIES: hypothetical protein [Hymenobacter]QJX46409.1 hypothetical protein HMJ29_05450 [Hymenobacter taeanensis]UOQ80270.1 hypothetical protein MUN83_15765 [Hymenobacter sp. 5414T-23]